MAKIILRSGYLDDYIALGENGQTIFDTALQIREALRLRKQQDLLDCLAIPQRNDEEDKVDWYAPEAGRVTSWASASESQRAHAIRYLENCQVCLSAIRERCLSADKRSIQLFGALLTNVLQFPASQHIYLVNDKPVITFWGFVNIKQSVREDALDCLRPLSEPEKLADSASVAVKQAQPLVSATENTASLQPEEKDDEELLDLQPTIVTLSQPAQSSVTQEAESVLQPTTPVPPLKTQSITPRGSSLMPKITTIAIVFIVIPLAWPYIKSTLSAMLQETDTFAVVDENMPLLPSVKPIVFHSLPLMPAQVMEPKTSVRQEKVITVAAKADLTAKSIDSTASVSNKQEPTNPVQALPKTEVPAKHVANALILPANEVKAGSTAFLKGTWRATIDLKDALTGKQPSLRYVFKDNVSYVRTMYGDAIVCKTNVHSGLMQSGNLVIKSRTKAACSDGGRYPIPEITCSQGLTGDAQCTGRYDDIVVPVTFIKVSK